MVDLPGSLSTPVIMGLILALMIRPMPHLDDKGFGRLL